MFKHKIMSFVFLAAFFILGRAYGQETIYEQQGMTINGAVSFVDTEGEVIRVKTDTQELTLYITDSSDLFRDTHHMASVEIEQGDPVTVKFNNGSSGKNNVISLVDHAPDPY